MIDREDGDWRLEKLWDINLWQTDRSKIRPRPPGPLCAISGYTPVCNTGQT